MHLLANSVTIEYKVTVPCSSSSAMQATYDKLQATLKSSVESGDFQNTLKSIASTNGMFRKILINSVFTKLLFLAIRTHSVFIL